MDGSITYTEVGEQKDCTDILLVGKTGYGKSSTGNSILGRRAFQCSANSTSVTKEAQMEYSDVGGRILKVVDEPGICDTDPDPTRAVELVIRGVQYAVAANPRGYHAILLVVRYGAKFTKEDSKAVDQLKGIFGSDFVEKFTIIVMTYGDTFDPEENDVRTFEEWYMKQEGEFKNLLTECGNRIILFDNRTKDVAKLNDQRQRLLIMIDSLSQRGERYSDMHFQMAKTARDRVLVKSKLPVIREESVMEASLIIQQLGKIQLDEPEQQMPRLRVLKRRAECLVQDIVDQERGTGVLQEVINNAKNICLGVDDQINNVKEAIEIQAQKMLCIQSEEKLQVTETFYREQAQVEAQKQEQNQSAELQSQIKDCQVRYEKLLERSRRSTLQTQQEYDSLKNRQDDNLVSTIVKIITEVLVGVVKSFFSDFKLQNKFASIQWDKLK